MCRKNQSGCPPLLTEQHAKRESGGNHLDDGCSRQDRVKKKKGWLEPCEVDRSTRARLQRRFAARRTFGIPTTRRGPGTISPSLFNADDSNEMKGRTSVNIAISSSMSGKITLYHFLLLSQSRLPPPATRFYRDSSANVGTASIYSLYRE